MDESIQTGEAVALPEAPISASDYGDAYLYKGDCMVSMRTMIADGFAGKFAAVICDPPYGIGFSGKKWDSPDTVAFRPEVWGLAMELLAPGGHLVAFGAPRTYHRLACAVEEAGFEIRDQLLWLHSQGKPVCQDVGQFIDLALGCVREPKVIPYTKSRIGNPKNRAVERPYITRARELGHHIKAGDVPVSPEANHWNGWGDNLKPGHESIVLARKPLASPTLARNALAYGCGPINVAACPGPNGTTTCNVLRDDSAEVEDAFPDVGKDKSAANYFSAFGWTPEEADVRQWHYCGKDKGNDYTHCTVKPLSLMRWLVRLLCPPGGVVLDPFSGSGTTLEAALLEGRYSVGCEMNEESWADTDKRIARVQAKLAA